MYILEMVSRVHMTVVAYAIQPNIIIDEVRETNIVSGMINSYQVKI
jgi:hypothetical protein